MFSARTPDDFTANPLSRAVQAARTDGRTIVDLTVSNPTQVGLEYPGDLLRPLSQSSSLTYIPCPFGALEAREAVADDYARRGFIVSPERILLTASTSEAYSFLFKLLADAGDDVLVPRPSYPLFEHLARLELVETRQYDLELERGWRIDFESLRSSVTPRTRAVLAVSPNNPTGTFVTAGEIDLLAAFCCERQLALIVDEVFADFEMTPGARASAGAVVDRKDVLTFSLGGLSKSVGLPQAKLSWIAVSGPDAVVAAALERLELICDTYLSVGTAVQMAASHLFERGAAVRQQIQRRVAANYRHLVDRVEHAPACRVLAAGGGWSAVLQIPSFGSEESFVLDLVSSDGVLVHPGYFFDFPRESFLVVSLLVSEASFVKGVDCILRRFVTASARHD